MKTLICYPSGSSAHATECRILSFPNTNDSSPPEGWTTHAVLDAVLPDGFPDAFIRIFNTLGISEACESYSDTTWADPLPASAIEVCLILTRALSEERYVRVPYTITERIGNTNECVEFRRRIVNVGNGQGGFV